MFPYIKQNVVIVEGIKSDGIYDLNIGKFHRINKEATRVLNKVNGVKELEEFEEAEKSFIKVAYAKGLILYQKERKVQNKTKLSSKIKETRPLRFAWIELTSKCNQNCIHCFMGQDLNKYNPLETKKIFSFIDVVYEKGITQLILTGGEPTLHPDFEQILDYAAKYDINIALLTNGTSVNLHKYIPKLRDYGVKSKISILGWGETHDYMVGVPGAFERLLNTIDMYIEQKAPIELGMTISSVNYMDIGRVREYANSKKIELEMSPVYPIGKARDNYDILYKHSQEEFNKLCQEDKKRQTVELLEFPKTKRKTRSIAATDYEATDLCNFLTNSFECGQKIIAVLASGKVSPCLLLRNEKFWIGDTATEYLNDILDYNNPRRKEYNEMMQLSNIHVCSKCEALYACKGGGCIAITQAMKGTIWESNPYYSKCYYKGKNYNEK